MLSDVFFGWFTLSDEYLKWVWMTTKVCSSSSWQWESSKWGHVKKNIFYKLSFHSATKVMSFSPIFSLHIIQEQQNHSVFETNIFRWQQEHSTSKQAQVVLLTEVTSLHFLTLLLVQSTKQNCNRMHPIFTFGCFIFISLHHQFHANITMGNKYLIFRYSIFSIFCHFEVWIRFIDTFISIFSLNIFFVL